MIFIDITNMNMTPDELRERNTMPDWHAKAPTAMAWRRTWTVNRPMPRLDVMLLTDKTWLPQILVDAGIFVSGSDVRKNRPDFLRDIDPDGEVITLKWAHLDIVVDRAMLAAKNDKDN